MTATCREYRGPRQSKGYGAPAIGGRQVLLHRWVVERVEGRPLERGEVVMHTCDNPACFLYEHLRRASQRENIADAVAKGRHRFVAHHGEANGGGGRLTRAQADAISEASGTQRALAASFGVSQTLVGKIKRGELWK